jgi:hypothetical protein
LSFGVLFSILCFLAHLDPAEKFHNRQEGHFKDETQECSKNQAQDVSPPKIQKLKSIFFFSKFHFQKLTFCKSPKWVGYLRLPTIKNTTTPCIKYMQYVSLSKTANTGCDKNLWTSPGIFRNYLKFCKGLGHLRILWCS